MKQNTILSLVTIALIFLGCGTNKQEHQFNNPLPVQFGDPYILKASDGITT
jgi:hypothetical protein